MKDRQVTFHSGHHFMKTTYVSIAMAGLLFTACGKKEPPPPQPTNAPAAENKTSEGNPITAPVDYLGAIAHGQKVARRTISTASLQQAIQMFNVSEGRYPASLDELVTKNYLPKVPPLPTGMKYDYDPKTGQVKAVQK